MEKVEQLFEELTKNNPLELLSQFIAPHLIGEEWKDIRKAILLMMATQNDGQQRMRLHTLLWGKAGTGKSVVGETPIIYRIGDNIKISPIKDLIKYKDVEFEVLSVNPETLEVEWKKVNGILRHKDDRKLLKITTIGNQIITATKDHSFLKYDYNKNRLVPIRGDELHKGDLIPIISFMPTKTKIYEYRNFDLDLDFGFFIGLWLADGDLNISTNIPTVRITNKNKKLLERIKEKLGGCIVYDNKRDIYIYHNNQQKIVEFIKLFLDLNIFKSLRGKGRGCRAKRMPYFCYNANDDFIRGILRGFFSGDGETDENIGVTTVNKILAQGISLLLFRLGIGNMIIEKTKKYKNKSFIVYYIRIPIYFLKDFYEKIGFVGKKQMQLEKRLKLKKFDFTVKVPISQKVFKELIRGKNMYERYTYKRVYTNGVRSRVNRGYISKIVAERFNKYLKSPILDKLLKSKIYFVPIKKIEEIEYRDYVYDLSVEDNENFVLANGIVTHNTEMLLALQEIFGGIIVNAEHTSKVGLVGDARGGMTAGLLADYDGNLVLLDELDKMGGRDQAGLLQAMEEGYYTIVKGKHRERFKAEVRVVATANNINKITKPLLDRFDFIFEVKTMPREERAKGVETIVENFFGNGEKKGHKVLRAYLNWIRDFEPMIEEGDTPIVVEMLRKYILLTKTAIDDVSYRNLELSILRIAYAMAKLEKSNIKPRHIEEAIIFKDRMLKKLVGVVDGRY